MKRESFDLNLLTAEGISMNSNTYPFHARLEFCEKLDKLIVAEGCYQSREYHRALMYLEQHMDSSNKGLSEALEGGLLAVSKLYIDVNLKTAQRTFPSRKSMHNWMNQMVYLVY